MKQLTVKFQREYNKIITKEDEELDVRKKYKKAIYNLEDVFKEELNKEKEKKRIPYPIAKSKRYELWKFFMSYNHVIQAMEFLEEPRYAVRKGQQWFEVTSIEREEK